MDWSHLSSRLRDHETSLQHIQNMATWYDLRLRLKKEQTIDKVAQKLIHKEKEYWKKFLAKHTLAYSSISSYLMQLRQP